MLLAGEALADSIVAIGNAPTALLTLLELLDEGLPEPALIIGMPVGFVNAAESKELLVHSGASLPCAARTQGRFPSGRRRSQRPGRHRGQKQ